jgi:Tfp pilus assembly pilus retraction ATPase PilT
VFHSNKAKLSTRAQSYHHRYQSAAHRIDLPGFTSKKLKIFSFALQNLFSKRIITVQLKVDFTIEVNHVSQFAINVYGFNN